MRKIILIGFGRRGKTIFGTLLGRRDVDVIGICDTDSSIDVPSQTTKYGDLERALSELKPNLAIICTPPVYHSKLLQVCNKFGLTVICEKPLVSRAEQLSEIRDLDIKVYTAYQLQFDPLIQKSFDLLKGTAVYSIQASQRVSMQEEGWKSNKPISGGGTLIDNSSHLINLAVSKFGKPNSIFSSWNSADDGVERQCDMILLYDTFNFRIHTDWQSAVGKENRITFYTDKYDVHYKENNQYAELYTLCSDTNSGWSAKLKTNIYPAKGLERNLHQDPLNLLASTTAIDTMLGAFLDDMDKGLTNFYCRQLDAAILTSTIVDKAYKYNKQIIDV